ncbi:MAG: hypothetical protein LBV69_12185 [Bacteroidales bacterium]|jgi:hypothetical protein|nr:hypothetical protein [Bacteroidales bacterium]
MDVRKMLLFGCLLAGISASPTFAQERPDSAVGRFFSLPPVETSISTGMSYSSRLGSAYFVEPSFSKQVTPKLRLNFGARYTRFNLKPLEFEVRRNAAETSSVRVWVDGEYKINDKWYVSAYAMKDIGGGIAGLSPFYYPTEAYGVAVDYIPSETVRFRAEFNFSRGYGGSWYDPWNSWSNPWGYAMSGAMGHYRSAPSWWMMHY